jgi:succinate-semialdehyde dehydrogenase/glutarate-semialdehyde dehydrogenase
MSDPIAVDNPANSRVLGFVESTGADDAVAAAAAASAARRAWREVPPTTRADQLDAIADVLRLEGRRLAETIVRENGKTLLEAAGEVDWAEAFFRTYASEARRLCARVLPKEPGKQPLSYPEPCGAVFAITPWNDPLGMIARQIAPALAAGCTVVWKPSPLTPLTARLFTELLATAGLPDGVLNVFVTSASEACVAAVLESRLVQKLVFTGSTATGFAIAGQAAARGIPSSLELGGNAACIVLPDADLDQAADGIVLRKFVQAGQGCTCVNRLFVQRDVAEPLLDLLVARASQIVLGDGFANGVTMGPLIRRHDVRRVDAVVDEATAAGAAIAWQGAMPRDSELAAGAFSPPRIVTGVADEMRLARDEIFGPVLPVLLFDDTAEAVRRANDVAHGLAGYVYGTRPRALQVAHELEVGLVGVNDASPQAPYYPVGGIKASGWGAAGGPEGLREYLVHRSMAVGDDPDQAAVQ